MGENREYTMLPMIDGSLIYKGTKGNEELISCDLTQSNLGVRATSVTARTLSENTPFHAQDGLLYNGEKLSKIYEIDLATGQLLNDFSSSRNKIPKKSSTSSFVVGRVDYLIHAFNIETGQEEVVTLIPLY